MLSSTALLVIDAQTASLSACPAALLVRINHRIMHAQHSGALVVYIANQGRKNKQAVEGKGGRKR